MRDIIKFIGIDTFEELLSMVPVQQKMSANTQFKSRQNNGLIDNLFNKTINEIGIINCGKHATTGRPNRILRNRLRKRKNNTYFTSEER